MMNLIFQSKHVSKTVSQTANSDDFLYFVLFQDNLPPPLVGFQVLHPAVQLQDRHVLDPWPVEPPEQTCSWKSSANPRRRQENRQKSAFFGTRQPKNKTRWLFINLWESAWWCKMPYNAVVAASFWESGLASLLPKRIWDFSLFCQGTELEVPTPKPLERSKEGSAKLTTAMVALAVCW